LNNKKQTWHQEHKPHYNVSKNLEFYTCTIDREYLHPYLALQDKISLRNLRSRSPNNHFLSCNQWMSTSLDTNGIWSSCLGHKLEVKKKNNWIAKLFYRDKCWHLIHLFKKVSFGAYRSKEFLDSIWNINITSLQLH
jgi:hypothetical protein